MNELKVAKEISPGIIIVDDVIDDPHHYINVCIEENSWNKSTVGVEEVEDPNYRTSNVTILDVQYDKPIEWHILSNTIWRYGNWYSEKYLIEFSEMEVLQLLHYPQGFGFYKTHWDDGPGMHRIFSALLYLNDVEEGGETYFTKLDISIKPKAGRLAIFPANYIFEHEARPPTKGDKFVVVTWFRPTP